MKKENKKNNDKTNECVQNSTNINWLITIYLRTPINHYK